MTTITPNMLNEAYQAKVERNALLAEKYMPGMIRFWKNQLKRKMKESLEYGNTSTSLTLEPLLYPRPNWPFWRGEQLYYSRENIQQHQLVKVWIKSFKESGFNHVELAIREEDESYTTGIFGSGETRTYKKDVLRLYIRA
jgi:hypothetical protein